jgi:MBG domain
MNFSRSFCVSILVALFTLVGPLSGAHAATITVTNNDDSGSGSLRDAIAAANPGDTIVFDSSLNGQTITLTSGELYVDKNLTIQGPGANLLTVSGNNASRVFEIAGGVTATISGLTITNGYVNLRPGFAQGGGIYNAGGLTVTNSTVLSNSVSGFSGAGGGIFNTGMLNIINSTLSGNSNDADHPQGGGVYNVGTVTVINSTFSGNSVSEGLARPSGGGIFNVGTVTVINSTFWGNSAPINGGGIYNGGTLTVTNSTFSENSATGTGGQAFGGGIYSDGTLNIGNTIIAGNTASTSSPDVQGGVSSQGYNLVGNTTGSSGSWVMTDIQNPPGGAMLSSLGDHGGPTQTLVPLSGSPAINAGSVALAVDQNNQPLTTDQRGAGRVINNMIDIGAVQSTAETPSLVVTTISDTTDPTDGQTTLHEAIAYAQFLGTGTVTFNDGSVSGATTNFYDGSPHAITLGGSELLISSGNVTIQGPGANLLTVSGNNASRVFEIAGGVTATIDGLTIASGHAESGGGASDSQGGGIYNGGNLTVTNSSFSGNEARGISGDQAYGGAIFSAAGSLTIANSAFSGNSVSVDESVAAGGGAVYANPATGSYATITNSTFIGNSATTSFGGASYGGGIFNGGVLSVTSSTLSNNTAGDFGGGIYNGGTLNIINGTLSNNSATFGGGVYNYYGTVSVTNSTLFDNTATFGGGVFNFGTTSLTVTSSTLFNNHAGLSGGGIFNDLGPLTVSDSTISGNSAGNDGNGGGIHSNGGIVTVGNTIIAVNTVALGQGPDVSGSVNSQGYNLIGDTSGSSGWVMTDLVGSAGSPLNPMLSSLGNYGGPTQTLVPLPGSPAIDAGSPNPLTTTTQAISPGTQSVTVTDASALVPGIFVLINLGQGDVEIVQVQSVSGNSFTAQFANSHSSNATVSLGSDQRGFGRPVNGVNDIGAVEAAFTTVTGPANQPAVNQPFTVNATVANATATGTETIQFLVDDVPFGSPVSLTTAAAGVSMTFSDTNAHTISAIYTNGGGSPEGNSNSISVTAINPVAQVNFIGGTTFTYNGSPQGPTATTDPANLSLSYSYKGINGTTYGPSSTPPTNAGSYCVTATVNQSPYTGSNSENFTIAKVDATISVTGYTVGYDGNSHTATGTATGVNNENLLADLNLSGTTHTTAGSYTDSWSFHDPNGNYNDANGTVHDVIATPPVINSLSVTPSTYWPKNNSMVPVTVNVSASSTLSTTAMITGITCNYPQGRYQITGDLTANLLAKKQRKKKGLVYTITVTVTDAVNQTTTATVTFSWQTH